MKADTNIDAAKWMDNYYEYLKNYAYAHVKNTLDVEEIIQETFLAGLRSKGNFQNRSSERTWLTAILRNKIVDHYRRNASRKGQIEKRMLSHEEHFSLYFYDVAITHCDETKLADMECEELKRLLHASIEKLPKSVARVAKLKFYDNLSTEEISHRLDISFSNVWVCLYRARASIARQLNKFDYAV